MKTPEGPRPPARGPVAPLDLSGLATYSLAERPSKVSVEAFARPVTPGGSLGAFLASLPDILLGRDFRVLAGRLADVCRRGKPLVIGLGAHVIKVGLSPLLIDLMERGLVAGLAMNGAGIVHDSELAMVGRTSEEVDEVIGSGAFGAARETGLIVNEGARRAAAAGIGLGAGLGALLLERDFPFNHLSLVATAARLGVPLTVHVALGTDIVHIHPSADGAAIGQASLHDFRVFAGLVAGLDGGAYLNIGSAVLLPEVFLKALTAARNLGHPVAAITCVNMDFIRQYRPLTNVVHRPTREGGQGFHLTGHHEIMVPLLVAALLEALAARPAATG
ncbi:MAG: hypothetical protein AB1634_01815 [Thermodesulfobacteriota bacterium]